MFIDEIDKITTCVPPPRSQLPPPRHACTRCCIACPAAPMSHVPRVCVARHSSSSGHRSPDASAEGVQRDLLPLVEGSIVNTKYVSGYALVVLMLRQDAAVLTGRACLHGWWVQARQREHGPHAVHRQWRIPLREAV